MEERKKDKILRAVNHEQDVMDFIYHLLFPCEFLRKAQAGERERHGVCLRQSCSGEGHNTKLPP